MKWAVVKVTVSLMIRLLLVGACSWGALNAWHRWTDSQPPSCDVVEVDKVWGRYYRMALVLLQSSGGSIDPIPDGLLPVGSAVFLEIPLEATFQFRQVGEVIGRSDCDWQGRKAKAVVAVIQPQFAPHVIGRRAEITYHRPRNQI